MVVVINGIISIDPNHATTDMLMEKLETTEGIEKKSISPEYYAEAKVDGELAVATGVDPKAHEKLLDGYFGFASNEGYQDFLRSEGNVVVLTSKIANKIEKKIGDTVTLDVNSHEVSFRVIGMGFFSSTVICSEAGMSVRRKVTCAFLPLAGIRPP